MPHGSLALLRGVICVLIAASLPVALAVPASLPVGSAEAELGRHDGEEACGASESLFELDDDEVGLNLLQASAKARRGRAASASSENVSHPWIDASSAAAASGWPFGEGVAWGGVLPHALAKETRVTKLNSEMSASGPPTPPKPPVVVPAPFNAPAPPAPSLVDALSNVIDYSRQITDIKGEKYNRQGKWIWDLVDYQRSTGGVGSISLKDTVPSPPPPPYDSRYAKKPTESPLIKPLDKSTELTNPAIQRERAHKWRDCTVADWTEWSCCGCIQPPGYDLAGEYQVRYRPVTTPHSKWGSACAPMEEVIDCVKGKPAFEFTLGALDVKSP